jgi:SAM-dependent methyltransferase/uncharacterized protein YbaR (Trm112 family)
VLKAPDLSLLRCPSTGLPLEADGDGQLVTSDGAVRHPIVRGVPVLLPSDGVFSAADVVADAERPRAGRRLVSRLRPRPEISVGIEDRYAALSAALRELAGQRPARVLVVGGGQLGVGMEAFASDPAIELVETDVYLGSRVDIVCDAHDLPFADSVFDGVVIQAVLEHVLDPVRVVAEIHRVLRPEGLVYAETPFMQQVHEGPFDFTRWSERGHRRLFRMFEELDTGVSVGPASALVWSLRYFARSLPRSPTAARVLDRIVTLAFFWLKHLDRRLVHNPGALDAASSVYFLGRRAMKPVPDLAIVAGYRGTIRSAAADRGIAD